MNYKYTPAILNLFLLFTAGWLLTSCLPEQQIAKTFTSGSHEIALFITPPEQVFKYSHRGDEIPGFAGMDSVQQDTMLWNSSLIIRYMNDSILLETYMNSFLNELRALGFSTFLRLPGDSVTSSAPQAYLVSVAQLQLDEYRMPYVDEQTISDTLYQKSIDLNAVDFSAWFELQKSTVKAPVTVLFSEHSITDEFDGNYYTDPFTGQIRYRYRIDTLRPGEIYRMAEILGERHAGYLYDHFLNLYILKNLPDGFEPMGYYHFNRKRNALIPVDEERFEILETRR